MLSSPENPSPDPPCPPSPPHEISQQLKSSDERASSSSDKVALQEEVVDLLNKSGSDDNNPPHKFSIRDYVFGARIKDIETNWPFSEKTLQLCQKHGVKNLLPPFHSLNAVTNQCFSRCTVEASSVEAEGIKISNEEPSAPNGRLVSVTSGDIGCGEKLPLDCVNIVPSKSDRGKEILSGLEKASPAKQKAESTNQPSLKKCKLIVKVGGTEPSANVDSMVNSVSFADTSMSSIVCPVCKNYSSSSNTTLNAHIDQCLSVESPSNLNENSRVIKHRIKPRKTKLMVDIYPTAPHCTLEELDRRNGSSWAVNSNMPIGETEFAAEVEEEQKEEADEEEQKEDAEDEEQKEDADEEDLEDEVEPRVSSVNFSGKGDSAVYIDANGTKVRILSKFNDISPSVPKLKEDHGHLKAGKGSSRNKLTSTFKKKHHIRKHHKYLNLTLDARSKKFCSPMSQHTFEVGEVQERNVSPEEKSWKEQSPVQPSSCPEKTNPYELGTIARWASSKPRVLLRKRSCKEGLQHLASNFRQEFPTESDSSCFTDPGKKLNCMQRTPNSYKHPLASPNCGKSMEEASVRSSVYEFNDQSSMRKRVGGASFGLQQRGNMEKCLEPPKKKQLRKDGNSIGESFKDFASNKVYHVPSFAFDPAETSSSHDKHVPSSKASKFSSPRKHISVNQSCLLDSMCKVGKNSSSSKKSEEVAVLSSDNVGEPDSLEKHAENQSRLEPVTGKVSLAKRSTVGIRKKRRAIGLASSSACNVDVRNRKDSSLRRGGDLADLSSDMDSGREGTAIHEDNLVSGPSSGVDVVGNVTSKSFDTEFHKINSPSNTTSGSLQSDVYKRSLCGTEMPLCPINRSFHDDQMFGEDEEPDVGVEMDSRDVQRDFFTEVDTIPIPGPPGSFLPSPRNMGSEDVQGISSLTVSRVQSSDDHYDLVDRDSSDSPISAKSTISNSKCAESSPAGYQDEIRSGFPDAGKPAKPLQDTAIHAQRTSQEEETMAATFPVRTSVSFRNDQPCCCSRKERTLLEGFTLTSVPEKNVAPAVKFPVDSVPKTTVGVSDSASPSGSNPVLRLMGKNLMVVNKCENVTEQSRPSARAVSSSNDYHPDRQSQTHSSVFPGTVGNANLDSARPTISNQTRYNTIATYSVPRTPQTLAHASGINSFGGLSKASFEQHEYGQQLRYRNIQPYPVPYNVERVATKTSDSRRYNAVSATNPMKEIIIIDDGPDTEANEPNRGGGGMSSNSRAIAGGFHAPPTAAISNHSCYVSPFYSFRAHDSSPYFQMSPQSRAGGSPNKWNRGPGGSPVLPPSSFAVPSPPPPTSSRLRPPPLYYTPNFS